MLNQTRGLFLRQPYRRVVLRTIARCLHEHLAAGRQRLRALDHLLAWCNRIIQHVEANIAMRRGRLVQIQTHTQRRRPRENTRDSRSTRTAHLEPNRAAAAELKWLGDHFRITATSLRRRQRARSISTRIIQGLTPAPLTDQQARTATAERERIRREAQMRLTLVVSGPGQQHAQVRYGPHFSIDNFANYRCIHYVVEHRVVPPRARVHFTSHLSGTVRTGHWYLNGPSTST